MDNFRQIPARAPSTRETQTRCAIYKNNRDGSFTDVTIKAGPEFAIRPRVCNTGARGLALGDFDKGGPIEVLINNSANVGPGYMAVHFHAIRMDVACRSAGLPLE
jgi:hypothetical protein